MRKIAERDKEEEKALKHIIWKATWFPFGIYMAFGLVFGIVLVSGDWRQSAFPYFLLPLTVLFLIFNAWFMAFFVVPRSLFKKRKLGQLLCASQDAYKKYHWKWAGSFVLLYVGVGATLMALNFIVRGLGSMIGSGGIIIAISAIVYANTCVARRMMKNGDATLIVKSKES